MDRQKQDELKQRLEQEQQSLWERIEHMEHNALDIPLQESVSELSSYDNHPGDLGSEVFERSKDFALREGMELQMAQIEDALHRMQSGTYGRCEECGREIPLERMEALPTASKCIECKSKEDLPDRHLRPIEEDVIVPPFGGLSHDNAADEPGDSEDEMMFDGEDAWQLLAHFNEHAEHSDAGAYYGGLDYDEDVGYVEDVDHIPYERGADRMIYGRVLDNEEVDNWLTQDEVPLKVPGEQLDDR